MNIDMTAKKDLVQSDHDLLIEIKTTVDASKRQIDKLTTLYDRVKSTEKELELCPHHGCDRQASKVMIFLTIITTISTALATYAVFFK